MGAPEENGYKSDDSTCKVFVTGFGVFKGFEDENPSWHIAKSLPPTLPEPLSEGTKVDIKVISEPLEVSYAAVEKFADQTYSDFAQSPYDVLLHIGVASGLEGFKVECMARRDKYPFKDVTGELPRQSYLDARKTFPEALTTTADPADVLERWKREVPRAQLAVSTDAGFYLCEYIYYASLSRTYQWRDSVTTLFLHVPPDMSEDAIELGREVALGLIRATIESKENQGR